jgi:hypothetical protein
MDFKIRDYRGAGGGGRGLCGGRGRRTPHWRPPRYRKAGHDDVEREPAVAGLLIAFGRVLTTAVIAGVTRALQKDQRATTECRRLELPARYPAPASRGSSARCAPGCRDQAPGRVRRARSSAFWRALHRFLRDLEEEGAPQWRRVSRVTPTPSEEGGPW